MYVSYLGQKADPRTNDPTDCAASVRFSWGEAKG